jgi:hypothetical protein
MSRLSTARMNAPGPEAYAGKKFLGFRKKQPRYNAPIALHGACRSALNEAIRKGDKDAADHIAKTQHLRIYSRVGKMSLLDLLAGILRGHRIVQ